MKLRLSVRARQNIWGFIFALPAVLLFAVFAAYPIFQTFYLSLFNYDLVRPKRFIGLENFGFLFADPAFKASIYNTFFYALGTYIPVVIIALLLAIALNSNVPYRDTFRMLNFIPVVISWAIVAIVWKLIFHQNGLANTALASLNVEPVRWLLSGSAAPWAIIIPSIWKELGFYMVIFLAGLQTIPADYYEASRIDGASGWQSFRYITLPLLQPILVFGIIIAIINGLKVFIPQFVMTQGGPSGATRVIALNIYETAFAFGRMGRASAMAVILFLIILVFTLMQHRLYGQKAS